jgi:hypothetical protein
MCTSNNVRCAAAWLSANGQYRSLLTENRQGFNFVQQVVASACGDRNSAIQQANLFDLDNKYADVVEEKEAIEKLSAGFS